MKSGLGALVEHVRGIPLEIRRFEDRSQGGNGTRSWLYESIGDGIRERIRQVRYYEDGWSVNSGVLAHYTTLDAAIRILREDEPMLRMYNLETANDPVEGRATPAEWEETVAGSQLMQEYGHDDGRTKPCSSYGVCFTSGKNVGDSLVWWRLYGDNGRGCCFVVPAARGDMYRVRYRRRGAP